MTREFIGQPLHHDPHAVESPDYYGDDSDTVEPEGDLLHDTFSDMAQVFSGKCSECGAAVDGMSEKDESDYNGQ